MTRDSRWPNIYVISCLAALSIVVLLAIATLNHGTYIDVNSARIKRQWEAGPIPAPFTREVVETAFSRLVVESRPARDVRAPLWKSVAGRMAFLRVYACSIGYGGAAADLDFLAALLHHLDPSREEKNELVSLAMDLLRDGELRTLKELVRELDERAVAAGP